MTIKKKEDYISRVLGLKLPDNKLLVSNYQTISSAKKNFKFPKKYAREISIQISSQKIIFKLKNKLKTISKLKSIVTFKTLDPQIISQNGTQIPTIGKPNKSTTNK